MQQEIHWDSDVDCDHHFIKMQRKEQSNYAYRREVIAEQFILNDATRTYIVTWNNDSIEND